MRPLALEQIFGHVQEMLEWAHDYPDLEFFITRIGCGLAGYKDAQIAPMFEGAPKNCIMPPEWKVWLGNGYKYHSGTCECRE